MYSVGSALYLDFYNFVVKKIIITNKNKFHVEQLFSNLSVVVLSNLI